MALVVQRLHCGLCFQLRHVRGFSLPAKLPDRYWAHLASYAGHIELTFRGLKQAGRETDNLPQSVLRLTKRVTVPYQLHMLN